MGEQVPLAPRVVSFCLNIVGRSTFCNALGEGERLGSGFRSIHRTCAVVASVSVQVIVTARLFEEIVRFSRPSSAPGQVDLRLESKCVLSSSSVSRWCFRTAGPVSALTILNDRKSYAEVLTVTS